MLSRASPWVQENTGFQLSLEQEGWVKIFVLRCRRLQLPKITGVSTLAKRKVEIREHLDGILEVLRGTQLIAEFPAQETEAEEADELMASAN